MSEQPEWVMAIREAIRKNRDGNMATSHLCRIVEKITENAIARAIDAATQGERERCAKVADAHAKEHGMHNEYDDLGAAREGMADRIAAAIRKGKQ